MHRVKIQEGSQCCWSRWTRGNVAGDPVRGQRRSACIRPCGKELDFTQNEMG